MAVCPFWASVETQQLPLKGDLLSSTHQFLMLCKQKHNSDDDDDDVGVTYNKHSYIYNI